MHICSATPGPKIFQIGLPECIWKANSLSEALMGGLIAGVCRGGDFVEDMDRSLLGIWPVAFRRSNQLEQCPRMLEDRTACTLRGAILLRGPGDNRVKCYVSAIAELLKLLW